MSELENKLDNLNTREDFIEFVQLLLADLQRNPNAWENNNLERYLDAVAAWTGDSDGFYKNIGEPKPQNVEWKVFANILWAATMYE